MNETKPPSLVQINFPIPSIPLTVCPLACGNMNYVTFSQAASNGVPLLTPSLTFLTQPSMFSRTAVFSWPNYFHLMHHDSAPVMERNEAN